MLRPLKRETLRERIVQEVKRAIIEGDLKPGDRLPTETALAESLGVSRSSVREATKALEFIGVLKSSPKSGCTVGAFDMRGVVDQLRFHLEAGKATLDELLDARLLLEVGILPLAVSRATEEDIAALEGYLDEMRRALDHGEPGIEHDIDFHNSLFKAARNGILESFSDVVREFFVVTREEFLKVDERARRSLNYHEDILKAIKSGDAARAQLAMTEHLEDVRKGFTKAG